MAKEKRLAGAWGAWRLGAVAACFVVGLFLSPAQASDDLVLLHYWTGALSGGIDQMAGAFNQEHPQYRLRATGFEHESFKAAIKAMLEGPNPPDLFSYWAGARVQALVDQGRIQPLDALWDTQNLGARFSPAVAAACSYNGHKYVVPVTQHYVAFFYNKKLFETHGLVAPRTWDEFLQVCQKLKDAQVTPLALGSREKWPAQFWFDYLLLRSAGHNYRERLMRGQASYADPAVAKVFTLWKELADKGFFNPNPNAYDWSEAAKTVFHGDAAMTLMGTWIIGLFDGKLDWRQGLDYDFFSFPRLDPDIDEVALGPIDAIAMATACSSPEAAAQVLTHFAGAASQMAMSKGSGALAPNILVPESFYPDMQRRIRKAIAAAPVWALNYDLATSPAVAELGLAAFFRFLERPDQAQQVARDLAAQCALWQ